ncbi:MAG: TIGR01212 family radical SAM protein [Deltaproteobacteria bacterium]|nr:TIGR01212 family radical SAM protein [Deltaproteobacteria bacterium]
MSNRPYNDLKSYLYKTFGKRVYKLTIDAGLTCPNRVRGSGCIYCNERGSGTGLWAQGVDIKTQVALGMEGLRRKYKKVDGFIAYFQSYTNTFASLKTLKTNWNIIKDFPEIVGLSIGTRPDCIDHERLELLSEYSSDYKVFLELGLQSINEENLRWINRGHSVEDFKKAVEMASKYPFDIVAHIIFGFPKQDIDEIIETAYFLSALKVQGVKIHLLYVAKGSLLHQLYDRGNFMPIEKDTYIEMVTTFLEHLAPEIVIHRLTGDAHRGELIAPTWSVDKTKIINEIEKRLKDRSSFQGKLHKL